MGAMSFTEAAELIKGSLDIVDQVQRFVVLKKSGRNYTGRCPFHDDKSPSMSVSREKNLFKCFACGVGGDTLSFLMRIENKTYGEAIRELAEAQGITILESHQSAEQQAQIKDAKQAMLALHTRSQQWYENLLVTSDTAEPVRRYLTNRGLDEAAIHRFGLGYAPEGWDGLVQYLRSAEACLRDNPDWLLESGLGNQKEGGSGVYDRFRHRLMVPIHDEKGQVVAFGGRALKDSRSGEEAKPKYLNSPETPIYHKSRILYGLHLAKDAIRAQRSAVIMEGYFDVIAAHQAGVATAVGSCGTALTEQHLKLLTRFGAETLYLAFDADEAGQRAALSAIQLIEPYMHMGAGQGLSVKILTLPADQPHKDPDEFIRAQGSAAFCALFESATPWLAFKFEHALKGQRFDTPEGRIDAVTKITPLLAAIHQPIVRAEMMHRYAERIGTAEDALLQEVKRYEQRSGTAAGTLGGAFGGRFGFPPGFESGGRGGKKPYGGYKSNWRNKKPMLTDNVNELRRPLIPSHVAAERDLLRLALLGSEPLQALRETLLASTFTQPAYGEIARRLKALFAQPESRYWELSDFLETINEALRLESSTPEGQARPSETSKTAITTSAQKGAQPPPTAQAQTAGVLAELAMTAERYAQELKLPVDQPFDQWQDRLMAEAERATSQMAAYQDRQALRTLNQSSSPEELAAIEAQYRLREALSQRHGGGQKPGGNP